MLDFIKNLITKLRNSVLESEISSPALRTQYDAVRQYLTDNFYDGSWMSEKADLYKLAQAEMRAIEAMCTKEKKK